MLALRAALTGAALALSVGAASLGAAERAVVESPRQIPVAYDVDVVVVGGSSGAVAAAEAAAKSGAKVFLAAPRPYLGEDLCGTMRLWLDEGQTPTTDLARKLFSEETDPRGAGSAVSLPFTYQADKPSAAKHKDTNPPSQLSDGRVGSSVCDSVQFNDDVTVTASLGGPRDVKEARMVLFHRDRDFSAQSVTVQCSEDGKTWQEIGVLNCVPDGETITVSTPIGRKIQFARFAVKRAQGASRLLLAEIALVPSQPQEAAVPAPKNPSRGPFRPMHIKKTLDDALLAAKVSFLYGCYATEVLRDAEGNPAGIVMANRAGRQAVRAKVIIDATDRAVVARMAGAQFQPYPAGPQRFQYVVIGGPVKTGPGIAGRKVGLSYAVPATADNKNPRNSVPAGSAEIIEYTLSIPMADGSFSSFARAEQIARDWTWDAKISFGTDELFQVPPDAMKGAKPGAGEWGGTSKLEIDSFRPAGVNRMFVLGGCADVPRDQAARLLRQTDFLELGERIGHEAAGLARTLPAAGEVAVASSAPGTAVPGEVKELLGGLRPVDRNLPTVASPRRSLPVLGEYDVVVVGGGTGGAPAGISAARAKARTLVLEYLHGLGGVGTTGLISVYYHGYRKGFTAEVPGCPAWDPRERAQWWRDELRKAGGDIWFGAIGCGALVEGGCLRGVVVATPQGRGVVLARNVIDATGNSDIAAAAGAATVFLDSTEMALQGTGLPPIRPGSRYTNTDFTIVDETDLLDVWHVMTYAKRKYDRLFDLGQLMDTRERRRIVGDFTMTLPDAVNGRTYPDTIHLAKSNFDTHGFTVDPYLLVEHPERKDIQVNVPLRCLLPSGLENILVTGLGISAHRDVMPLLRMQPDIQNQGYAAGFIAATAARKEQPLRALDLKPIQSQLAKMEILPDSALAARDSYPLPAEQIAQAVVSVKDGHGMAVIVTHPKQSLPLLQQAYAAAKSDAEKLVYAKILGILGDATGIDALIREVESKEWDKGWNYIGMGQFGSSLSRVDMAILSLARTKDRRALPPILKKASQLKPGSDFSHFRTIALALETLGDPSAAPVLATLLGKPGMGGYATTTIDQAADRSGANPCDNSTRQTSIRELYLARALLRCGDQDGLGRKILTEYAKDLRGAWARHAQAVLDEK